ncbi:MAG: acyltransferase domain-containing protein [Deltaproteobacteria bacterium]|nr:acyltransferase domain-containing protein [Deltaproteobacteria bacterium]
MSVAIIGMGCLFPKASDLKEFWRLLYNGEDGISDVPDTHWSVKDYFDEKPKYPDHTYCKRGGFLSPVSYDPSEFGMPPKILEATDTAQLLGLLVAKRALEDAGYGDGTKFSHEKTNVIIGVTGTQELVIPLSSRLGHPIWRKALEDSGVPRDQADDVMERISDSYVSWQESSFPGLLGNVVAGRIANRLDLGGTNCVVDAACASSTSALNFAVLELLSGKCDMSITGGVDTLNDIFMHMCFSQTGVLSFSSDIRPFSEDADGTVLGEGIGLMVLKRLDDAEKDGDRIYAVIKSVGSSSDGRSQSIYAPNVAGQVKALKAAYREADVDPTTLELIEAHGTGTMVGDAVEFSALKEVFKDAGKEFKKCAVGSVKSNIGHTKAAAGAAGIIKAALSLHHKVLPPTLKVGNPDPKIEIENSNFYLNTSTRPWFSRKGHPRRSGVSSFGFGGSNFHVVLEEYKKNKSFISWTGAVEILAFSAKTKDELADQISALKFAVENMSAFSELAFKAYETRNSFSSKHNYRLLIVIERPDSGMISDIDNPKHLLNEILENLKKNESPQFNKANIYFGNPETKGKLAFIFPGQGSQYCNMGNDLACCLPEADELFQKAKTKFKKEADSDAVSFTDLIFPLPDGDQKLNETNLRSTDVAQPAIGCTSLLMLKFLDRFGVKPDAACGHSFGELTALYAAGKMDEDTFLSLAVKRGKYMADAGKGEKGAMLAVKAPLDKIDRLIEENNLDVVLANRNSPEQGVLSGSEDAIAEAMNICKENGFRSTSLPVAAAFHSRLVKDAAKPFKKALTKITLKKSDIPVFSNTTGDPFPEKQEDAVKILGDQILNPVNFVTEIEHLYESGIRTFIEVGPKPVLTGLVKSILKDRDFRATSLDKSSGRQSGIADLAHALCFIAADGHNVDFVNWEDKPKPAKKQKMSVPISGANYRSEYEIKPPAVLSAKPLAMSPLKESLPTAPENRTATRTVQKQHAPQPDKFASSALTTITESLKSLQTLQIQTAETHKKFLETQSEASRSLQKMLDRTRYMAESAVNLKTSQPLPERILQDRVPPKKLIPDELVSDKSEHVEPVHAATPVKSSYPEIEPPRTDPDLIVKPDAKEETKASPVAISGDIEKKMIEVVSDLTGYPEEMIELDMDIESDLGIDSIKRVEILSAFENKMPGLPSVSADVIGSLK